MDVGGKRCSELVGRCNDDAQLDPVQVELIFAAEIFEVPDSNLDHT